MTKRYSYTAARKLEIVNYAKEHGNRAAGRNFLVGESSVREWRKDELVLKMIQPTKRAVRGRKEYYPEIEEALKNWVLEKRSKGFKVSTIEIKLQALLISKILECNNFKASNQWCNNFMNRKRLSLRAVTSTGQNLPDNWEESVRSFSTYVKNHTINCTLENIGNVDEIPMTFDLPSKFTVDQKGKQDIKIKTTGAEKCSFTVVLAVTADGSKLNPMVIFKRKTIPKGNFHKDIIIQANPKGWINEDMFSLWIREVWQKRKASFFSSPSLIIYDSAPAHLTEKVLKVVKQRSMPAVIPGGLTKILQPLDISVNKSFKSKVRKMWEKWMINGYHEYTKKGNMKKASYEEVCKWIVESWNEITPECIKNGFSKGKLICYPESITETETYFSSENDDDIEDDLLELLQDFEFESEGSNFCGFQ